MKATYSLPDMKHRFTIQTIGKETGLNWHGEFVYQRPNLVTRTRIETVQRRMSGDLLTIDQDIADLNYALAVLRFTIVEAPEWWTAADNGGALFDANVVLEVFNKCMDFEKEWKKKVHGGNPEDVQLKEGASETVERVADGVNP